MQRLKFWFPHPLMSAALAALWLLLANSLSALNVLGALLLAVLLPFAMRPFWPEQPRVRRPLAILRLALVVLWDILHANLNVARLVLGPLARLRPAFVKVPLTLRDPLAVTILANIITLTPGTLTVDVSRDRRYLLIHGLDVADDRALVAEIKARYEAPLREIFE